MALIICQECGREISDKATSCPNCGYPISEMTKSEQPQTEQAYAYTDENYNNCVNNFQKKEPSLKESILGVAGLILSLIFCIPIFPLAGLTMCIVATQDKTRKTNCAKIGIFTSLIFLLISVAAWTSNYSETSTTQEPDTKVENTIEEPAKSSTPKHTETPNPTLLPEETEEEYKESCKEFKYKDVLRNPEDYVGKRIFVEVEISSVHSEDLVTPVKYYFGNTKDEPDNTYYYGDRYAIFDYRNNNDLKILTDDVIIVWGEISAPQETESWIVNSEELFCIDMKYVELISE